MTVQRKYLELFLEEGVEILGKLDQKMLALERDPEDGETLQSVLRLAHTLKGGAKMVGLDNVSAAAHAMESELKAAVGERRLSGDLCTRFLTTLDAIRGVLGLVGRGREAEALASKLPGPGIAAPNGPVRAALAPSPGAAEVLEGRRLGADRVRVGVEKLDALQNLVDDLTLHSARMVERLTGFRRALKNLDGVDLEGTAPPEPHVWKRVQGLLRSLSGEPLADFLEEFHRLGQVTGEIQDQVFDLRMVSLAEVLDEYQRTVRDLSRELGKEAELVIDGRFTEMDKRLLDAIQAPLMHLVRNALDHGIESPGERARAGKPARGRVWIRAYHKGSAVVLEVEDDGRGLDASEIRTRAVTAGVLQPREAEALSDEEVVYLLCAPEFTTRTAVSEVSGRGVGLDVVKVVVEKLKGSLSITGERGSFSRFRMYLPLSISSLSALVVRVGSERFAIPSLFVRRCFAADASALTEADGTWTYEGRVMPVVSLARALQIEERSPPERVHLVALHFRSKVLMLQVDELLEEREIVLKPLGSHLREVPCVLGVSLLADGCPVPVLSVVDLHGRWSALERAGRFRGEGIAAPATILVVDDSVTTRHMERHILEDLGYDVVVASDGREAWSLLESQPIDLVLTDVEMPGMDGLELTRRIRAQESTSHLPVVVVSNRASDTDREAGFAEGADAYIPKDRFSQRELRATLGGLLARRTTGDRSSSGFGEPASAVVVRP